MSIDVIESIWLNTTDICSIEHLVEVSGLAQQELLDLIETGVIEPSGQERGTYFFHMSSIVAARTARRLRDDFELDAHGLALALSLLRRIDRLEAEVASLRAGAAHEKK